MILSNLVSTFAPCMISHHVAQPSPIPSTDLRDDLEAKTSKSLDENASLCDNEIQDAIGDLINSTSSPSKLKRNASLQRKSTAR